MRRASRRSLEHALPALLRLERSTASPGGQMRLLLHDLLTADIDGPSEWNSLMGRLRDLLPQLADAQLRGLGRFSPYGVSPTCGLGSRHRPPPN
ncbi:hypothetical protein [Streptomyces sp. NPDC057909]|uniref:hypothetical protein n=1 Tax=Streptomyces sp. NPDC057909 TaxID=3346277 RepID=UPI0036E07D36